MDVLGKILGSTARVKIMRLFLINQKIGFAKKDIIKRSRVTASAVAKELRVLASVDFIKKTQRVWHFNTSFKYAKEFERLLVNPESVDLKALGDNFKKTGRIKLLLVSGAFIKNKDTRVDMLIVGDRVKKSKVEDEIKKLEAEMGAEISYALFDTKEFLYRLDMYDKLIRDILDFPHEVVLRGKELSTQVLKIG